MAEDISNFNDRQWKEQCRQKVLDELERKEEEREGMLADAESQRILKLKLQGIIRYDNEEDTRTEKSTMKKTPSERRFDKRSTKKQQSLFKPNDIETQMEILNRDESEIRSRNRSRNEAYDSNGGIRGNDEETTNGEDYSALPTYKSQLGRTQADTKEVHPQLKELYEEEDLQQLYREAETLVRRTTRNK
uniref:Uncharacterized protein n=2 Tax=Arion vulgaris TaxID=1028688 RepID=A0A0B6ZP54_9EUPU